MEKQPVDRFFFGIVATLIIVGVFIFISASLGVLARNESKFYGVLFNQLVLGLGGGLIAMFICSKIPYKFWKKFSFYFFIASIILTTLVFIPGVGFSHGGARRWIEIGSFSFQPAEILKLAFVIYFAAWLSWLKTR